MKIKVLPITLLSIFVLFLFLSVFFSDTILFYTASIDDKLYGTDNKYIDATLSEPQLSHPSNLKDSYKYQSNTNDWNMKLIDWFIIVLKIFGIMLIPLFVWVFFIRNETGIFGFLDDLFGKKE